MSGDLFYDQEVKKLKDKYLTFNLYQATSLKVVVVQSLQNNKIDKSVGLLGRQI